MADIESKVVPPEHFEKDGEFGDVSVISEPLSDAEDRRILRKLDRKSVVSTLMSSAF